MLLLCDLTFAILLYYKWLWRNNLIIKTWYAYCIRFLSAKVVRILSYWSRSAHARSGFQVGRRLQIRILQDIFRRSGSSDERVPTPIDNIRNIPFVNEYVSPWSFRDSYFFVNERIFISPQISFYRCALLKKGVIICLVRKNGMCF